MDKVVRVTKQVLIGVIYFKPDLNVLCEHSECALEWCQQTSYHILRDQLPAVLQETQHRWKCDLFYNFS